MSKPKVIAVVGPTASGKSTLAIELALALNGEVISADSRQVYRGMDIGTGKVTVTEMRGVPHHLLDVADPATTTYTAHDFARDAARSIAAIHERGHLPIIAGGTFFYLDILRGKMSPAPVPANEALRQELEAMPPTELYTRLQALDPKRAATIDAANPRRLIRAIEVATALGHVPVVTQTDSPYTWLVLGIDIPTDTLRERINTRLTERLNSGMIEEVAELHTQGVSWERLSSFGLEYRYCAKFLQGEIDQTTLESELSNKIHQFAKRQRTWLRGDKEIVWLPFPIDKATALETTTKFLSN